MAGGATVSVLRDYQRQALAAIREAREAAPDVNRLAIEMATGLGKTITFAAAADEFLDAHYRHEDRDHEADLTSSRVLVLVHTDELVRQAVEKIQAVTRGRWTIGVVKAERDEVTADIVVASVQTLARPERRERIEHVGLIIVDECHHAVADSYRTILEHFHGICPSPAHCQGVGMPAVPVLGVTATLARSDGQGLGAVWQDMVFSRSLAWGIRHGYLIDLVPYTIKIPGLDAGASDAALDAMMADSIAPEAVVQAWMDHGGVDQATDLRGCYWGPSTVLFAPLVRSAEAFAAAFSEAGVKAEVIHGKLPDAERRAILERYEAGITTVLCNAMVLTEGWDSPRTMCVIVARPTQSVPLFVQMVGRGVRPWLGPEAPAREDQRCILLCVAGTSTDLATVADLSDHPVDGQDGKSLMQMEDEWDIGRELDTDEDRAYRGPVVVERWDEAVRRSTKAWKYTEGGVPFLPTAKRGEGYVFITPVEDHWTVWARQPASMHMKGRYASLLCATAPDLELAMALAEDEAQERGGDIGRLLADKSRAWRKGVPSSEMLALAARVGVPGREVGRIMCQRAAGKAGKLSDLIDKVMASRVLDGIAAQIRERASK